MEMMRVEIKRKELLEGTGISIDLPMSEAFRRSDYLFDKLAATGKLDRFEVIVYPRPNHEH